VSWVEDNIAQQWCQMARNGEKSSNSPLLGTASRQGFTLHDRFAETVINNPSNPRH
jgi:hypothetical protein